MSDQETDYSILFLTAANKYWMVNEILEGRTSGAKLAKKYNLNRNTINSYVTLVRNHKPLRSFPHRPYIIDRIAYDDAFNTVTDEMLEVPEQTEVIKTAFFSTLYRKRPIDFKEVIESESALLFYSSVWHNPTQTQSHVKNY